MGKLKVLLVVGDLEMRKRLDEILGADIDLDIVAEANNAYMARDKIITLVPPLVQTAFLLLLTTPHPQAFLADCKYFPVRVLPNFSRKR